MEDKSKSNCTIQNSKKLFIRFRVKKISSPLEWARTGNIIRPVASTKFVIEKQTIRTILNFSSETMKAHVKCIASVINFVNSVRTERKCFTFGHWNSFTAFCMACPKEPSWCIFFTSFETIPVNLKWFKLTSGFWHLTKNFFGTWSFSELPHSTFSGQSQTSWCSLKNSPSGQYWFGYWTPSWQT